MSGSSTVNRRKLLKAGAGSIGAAGLAGLGLVAVTPRQAQAAANQTGLKPLYSKKSQKASLQSPIFEPLSAVSALPPDNIRALRRLTFGYRPQDLPEFEALGSNFDERLQNYVDAQLAGYQAGYPPTNDPPLTAVLNGTNFSTLDDSLQTLWQERVVAEPDWPDYQYPVVDTRYLTMLRAIHSQWQLAEVLADFWHTHFNVDGNKFEVSPVFVHYDRDVIRPNMLGNFRQMLEAVTKSTAMMRYLDNASNTKYGPNENFAREIQELHTLGAVHSFGFMAEQDIPAASPMAGSATTLPAGLKAGYSETDVRQLTLCLTGWTISNAWSDGLNTGEFIYLADWHETSTKKVLGIDIVNNGQAETTQVLDLLAIHPNTARYVCEKLCKRLISDNPPASIVEAAAVVFNDQWQAADQLSQVVRTIILSPEFKDAANWGQKTKKPFELVIGSARSCGGFTSRLVRPDMSNWQTNLLLGEHFAFSQDMYWQLGNTGNQPFSWATPDGFPDTRQAWLGSTPLVMSWRMLNSLFLNWYPDNPADPNATWHAYFPIDAVAVTRNALSVEQRSARNIVNYWVLQFFGYDSAQPATPQLDAAIRDKLIAFMQQDAFDADVALDLDASGWDNSPSNAYVPHRLQTLVASIAMLPDNLLR